MEYSLKAKCVSTAQHPDSLHVATLVDNSGNELVLPAKHWAFEVGKEYVVLAHLSSPAPAPKPVTPAPKPPQVVAPKKP